MRPGPGGERQAPSSPAAPRQEAFSARGRAERYAPPPGSRPLGLARAPRPWHGRGRRAASGRPASRNGPRAAGNPRRGPGATPRLPDPARGVLARWRPTPEPRAAREANAGRWHSPGHRDLPAVPPRVPVSAVPEPAGRGPGPREAGRPGSRALPVGGSSPVVRPPSPRSARPQHARVKKGQVCRQMPLTTPLPAVPSASSSSAHPLRTKQSQIKVLLLPFPTPVAAPPPGAEPGPLFTCPGAGRGEGKWGLRAGTSALSQPPASPPLVPPALIPRPVAGAVAWGVEGSLLA